jgi:hypothetical protein
MNKYQCLTWDLERFPDHLKMIKDLHDQHFKVVTTKKNVAQSSLQDGWSWQHSHIRSTEHILLKVVVNKDHGHSVITLKKYLEMRSS